MPTHVMLDLETWGLAPGSDIRSIGAVVFDPVAGTLGSEFYLAVDNPLLRYPGTGAGPATSQPRHPLTRDAATVQWWSEQSPEARAAFNDAVDLQEGLAQFTAWFKMVDTDYGTRLWANGPHFDEAILAGCYRAVGLPVPWHYRAPRDCRTIWDLVGGLDLPFQGTAHNALDDAKHQARCVIEGYRKLGLAARPDNRVSELLSANNRALEQQREAVRLLRKVRVTGDQDEGLSAEIDAFLKGLHRHD